MNLFNHILFFILCIIAIGANVIPALTDRETPEWLDNTIVIVIVVIIIYFTFLICFLPNLLM
jgi:hypothetical protein